MASPVMVCFLPVFLYFPVTWVNNIIKLLIRFRWDIICWIKHVIRLGWHVLSWNVILVILTVQLVEVAKEIVTPQHFTFLGLQLGTTWWFVLNLQKIKQTIHTYRYNTYDEHIWELLKSKAVMYSSPTFEMALQSSKKLTAILQANFACYHMVVEYFSNPNIKKSPFRIWLGPHWQSLKRLDKE